MALQVTKDFPVLVAPCWGNLGRPVRGGICPALPTFSSASGSALGAGRLGRDQGLVLAQLHGNNPTPTQ